eukprot:TRINITY_DN2967_c2_g1_i2.p1 TRINITY_DN2967_c2_g1~~TRINITY_DN2967_c2_g1_i2.p1  ORF type:complete len:218 (+),score=16.36 TRINITY_DN2967_c2_g1_i2:60-656(+)
MSLSSDSLRKLQQLAQTTASAIQHASETLKAQFANTAVTAYGQRMTSEVVHTGVTGIAYQVQQILMQIWRKFVELLDVKGIREPLEKSCAKFWGLPVVEFVMRLLASFLSFVFQRRLGIGEQREVPQKQQVERPASRNTVRRLPKLQKKLCKKPQASEGWFQRVYRLVGFNASSNQNQEAPMLLDDQQPTKYWKRRSA